MLFRSDQMGVSREIYDEIASSGDAAQIAMTSGVVGRKVFHLGPERDLGFFTDENGPIDVERVPLDMAEGIVCTGLFDDARDSLEDYRLTILDGVNRGLKLLCANPDVLVDVGDKRLYFAGASSEDHTSELQSRRNLVCRLLLDKTKVFFLVLDFAVPG